MSRHVVSILLLAVVPVAIGSCHQTEDLGRFPDGGAGSGGTVGGTGGGTGKGGGGAGRGGGGGSIGSAGNGGTGGIAGSRGGAGGSAGGIAGAAGGAAGGGTGAGRGGMSGQSGASGAGGVGGAAAASGSGGAGAAGTTGTAGGAGGSPPGTCGGPLGWGTSPFAVLSPDGTLVAIASPPGLLSVTSWSDGTPSPISNGVFGARSMQFSGDGKLLVASADDALKVWRVSDGALVHAEPALARALNIGVSMDGSVIAASRLLDTPNTVKVWRAADPTNIRALQPTMPAITLVSGVAVSADGTLIYATYNARYMQSLTDYDEWLVAWHTTDGTRAFEVDIAPGPYMGAVFSVIADHGGASLAASADAALRQAEEWNAATGVSLGTLQASNSLAAYGKVVTFSLDDSAILMMTGSGAGGPPTYGALALFRTSDRMLARSVAALAGDKIMGGGLGPALAVRSVERTTDQFVMVENQAKVRSVGASSVFSAVAGLAWVASSADGQWVATAASSGTSSISVWNSATGVVARSLAAGGPIAMSADGSRVFSASGTHLRVEQGFDVDTGSYVEALDLAPAGDLIAVGKSDNTAEVRRTTDGGVAQTLWNINDGHTGSVQAIAFSKDGSLVATGSYDKTVKLWRVSNGTFLRTIAAGNTVTSVTFNGDGSWILVGDGAGNLTRFKVADGSSLGSHNLGTAAPAAPKLSPDDATAYVPGPSSVLVFRVADWTALPSLPGHTDVVQQLALSSDGKRLASVSIDQTARIYCLP
jgi:WD40 repeat protein